MILFYVFIYFQYWFGFAKMKKFFLLTLLLNFAHVALHPVTNLEASLHGSDGGTFRYPLDCKAFQQCGVGAVRPGHDVVKLLFFLDWANIFS